MATPRIVIRARKPNPALSLPGASVSIELPASFIDAVAERAAELALERLAEPREASPYVNVEEAADYLRCDRQRIYDLLSARRLSKFKDGSRVLLLRSDLDEYVSRGVADRRTNGY